MLAVRGDHEKDVRGDNLSPWIRTIGLVDPSGMTFRLLKLRIGEQLESKKD